MYNRYIPDEMPYTWIGPETEGAAGEKRETMPGPTKATSDGTVSGERRKGGKTEGTYAYIKRTIEHWKGMWSGGKIDTGDLLLILILLLLLKEGDDPELIVILGLILFFERGEDWGKRSEKEEKGRGRPMPSP